MIHGFYLQRRFKYVAKMGSSVRRCNVTYAGSWVTKEVKSRTAQ